MCKFIVFLSNEQIIGLFFRGDKDELFSLYRMAMVSLFIEEILNKGKKRELDFRKKTSSLI
jgi:hypothetical protein